MSSMTPDDDGRRHWGRAALICVITGLGVALMPVFFADMFRTVSHLLSPWFGRWAWTVPAATEGSFALLYLLDLLLQMEGKPMGWLRFAPYPFALASLTLNVYAGRGSIPATIGHGVITVAFFLPVLAGEGAVRRLSRTEAEIRLAAEADHALRHARDLARAARGIFWRFRVPSLLRVEITGKRPPAAVVAAIRAGSQDGGALKWEPAVARWVRDGLTQDARLTAEVTVERREIQRQADDAGARPAKAARPASRQNRQLTQAAANRAAVLKIKKDHPDLTAAQVAAKAKVSKRTVQRHLSGGPDLYAVDAAGG